MQSQTQIDYRNAKYQGQTNSNELRHGYGILIDDDLSLYSSHWLEGKLNQSTVIYISHGKYIYGQWDNNQPHGLNVFRIGDTVLLGEFQAGYIVRKAIVIFQKVNFVALLQQKRNGQWGVWKRGIIKSYNQLVTYIEDAGIPMKPQYFSLSKFLTSISNSRAAAVPCQGSENCYYGYDEGLGITFNSNNGVVSVGNHTNKKLSEFGGKFEHPNFVIEGNFNTNEIVRYSNERPKQQIYSIYQKMHKRSLNFKNEYFDSKVKLLTHVQELIRSKIDEIMDMGAGEQENTFTALDLNDSLDYHAENLEEINRIRQEVYENVHIPMKKTISQYVDNSPQPNSKKVTYTTPSRKKMQLIINAPASPIPMKKSPIKKDKQKQKEPERQRNKQRERQRIQERVQQKQFSRTPSKRGNLTRIETYQNNEHTFANLQQGIQKQPSRCLSRTPTKKVLAKNQYQCKPEPYSNLNIQQRPILTSLNSHLESQTSNSSSSIKKPISQLQGKTTPYAGKNQNSSASYLDTHNNDNHSQSPLKTYNISNPYSYSKRNQLKQDERFQSSQQEPNSPIDQILVSSKNYLREKQMYNVPSFKYSCSQFDKNTQTNKSRVNEAKLTVSQRFQRTQKQKNQRNQRISNVDWIDSCQQRNSVSPLQTTKRFTDGKYTELSKSPIKGPNYENLSERRRRLLKQFKNLNQGQQSFGTTNLLSKIIPTIPNLIKTTSLPTQPQPIISSQQQRKKQIPKSYNLQIQLDELQSPCAKQKFPSYQSKNTDQQSQTMMPLTICKNSNDIQPDWKKRPQQFGQRQQKNERQEYKQYEPKQYTKQNLTEQYKIQRGYVDRSYKQNQESEIRQNRPFEKKQSYYQKAKQMQKLQRDDRDQNSLTPNRRKAYRYYFDE